MAPEVACLGFQLLRLQVSLQSTGHTRAFSSRSRCGSGRNISTLAQFMFKRGMVSAHELSAHERCVLLQRLALVDNCKFKLSLGVGILSW
jgi:hypothetical protein